MKIDAVSDRGRKRDFIDLFFIAQKYSLEEILNFYEGKYRLLETNRLHIIKSLAYFAEAENDPLPQMLEDVSWEQIKKFFEKEAVRISQKYL